ncbi:MAG: hypothetical protein EB072_11755 [Betaproteobacteria bacterium]|nr:hypothetical protein [Betaproteobacteria bacterium]
MTVVSSSSAKFLSEFGSIAVVQPRVFGLLMSFTAIPIQAASEPLDMMWHQAPAALLDQRLPVATHASNQFQHNESWSVMADVSAYAASKVVDLLSAEKSLPRLTATEPTEHGVVSTRASLSASRSGWEASLNYRQLYSASARDGALQIVRAYTAPEKLPDGRALVFDAKLKLLDLSGVGFARSWPVQLSPHSGSVTLTTAARLQTIRRFASFQANGNLLRTRDSYAFDGSGELRDSQGESYGIDMGIAWQPTERSSILFSVVDAWSRARISDVASQNATLRSDTRIVNNQGYLVSQPSVEGRYSAESLLFKIPPVYTLAMVSTWMIPLGGFTNNRLPSAAQVTTGLRLQRTSDINLRSVWASTSISSNCQAVAEVEFTFDSKGLGVSCPWGRVMLRSNTGALSNARSLGLNLTFHHRVAS